MIRDLLTIDPMEHTGLIHTVLNTHTWLFSNRSPWTYDDAYQEGFIALLEALATYNPDTCALSTHCINTIKWGLYRAYREQSGMIRIPGNLHDLRAKYKRIRREYLETQMRDPDPQYMAAQMKMSVPGLMHFLDLFEPIKSLNSPISGAEDLTLADTIRDERDHYDTIELQIHKKQLRADLERMMSSQLTDYNQQLLKDLYGWNGGQQLSVKHLAEKRNESPEAIREKIYQSHKRLKKFRPELAKHYPDIIMSQIYKQSASSMVGLRRLGAEMLLIYLKIGDLIQVNDKYGAVMAVLNSDSCFEFRSCGHTTRISVKNVYDFEMMDNKITRVYTVQKKRDPDSARVGGSPNSVQ